MVIRCIRGPIFRRNLTESEENHFFSLLDLLSQVFVNLDVEDCRIWTASKERIFSISRDRKEIIPLYRLWKLKIPQRVMMFGWLALRGGILTIDNLCRHKKTLVSACPMGLAD